MADATTSGRNFVIKYATIADLRNAIPLYFYTILYDYTTASYSYGEMFTEDFRLR